MGIQGFSYLHDFRDPIVIIGTLFAGRKSLMSWMILRKYVAESGGFVVYSVV